MIVRNGKTAAGWRLDEMSQDGPAGMDMLMNPFAIVPKEENANRIVMAFEQVYQANELLRDVLTALELYAIEDPQAHSALGAVHERIVNYAP